MDAIPASRFTRRTARLVLLAAVFACAACLVAPASAQAKSYEIENVRIDATIAADGTLSVVETRRYHFDGDFTLVGRILDPPDGGQCTLAGVSAGAAGELPEVAFKAGWRDAGGPGGWCYSFDAEEETVYVFGEYSDETIDITWTYSYTNALTRYSDMAELYWQFVGSQEEVSVNDARVSIDLPVPPMARARAGDNVRVWGHGALSGDVTLDEGGTATYTCPYVSSGNYAEARIAFPASWAPDVAASCVKDGNALDRIVAEETQWADEANAQRARYAFLQTLLLALTMGLPPLLLLVSFVLWLRFGKEHRPEFSDEYWRDVPAPGVDPAVVGRIVRWNERSSKDVTAQLVHLSAQGAVSLEPCTETVERKILADKVQDTFRLRCLKPADSLKGLDGETVKLVFVKLVEKDSLTPYELEKASKEDPGAAVAAVDSWQHKLDDMVKKAGYFEKRGDKISTVFSVLAGVLFFVGIFFFAMADLPFASVLVPLVCCAGTYFFARNMKRRSHEAAEIAAKSKALKRWFKDFTNLKEAIPTDAKVWGELLAYATLFGVADEVVDKLRVAVPELFDDPVFVPCTYWGTTSVGSSFDSSFTNAVSSGESSSGAGGGGGFSGGGGGGFGGGGGGFAR